jgi:hypothetical protein
MVVVEHTPSHAIPGVGSVNESTSSGLAPRPGDSPPAGLGTLAEAIPEILFFQTTVFRSDSEHRKSPPRTRTSVGKTILCARVRVAGPEACAISY